MVRGNDAAEHGKQFHPVLPQGNGRKKTVDKFLRMFGYELKKEEQWEKPPKK